MLKNNVLDVSKLKDSEKELLGIKGDMSNKDILSAIKVALKFSKLGIFLVNLNS